MPDSSQFTWDFDRPPAQVLQTYSTFSVGVFQWLKKTSGKGIKKSAATTRVLGYTGEPDRVYAKANQLCARLNREAANANSPPSWLQKQYSIPRPAGTTRVKRFDEFTAAQVRSARLSVMKDRLLATGFIVGKDATYVRRHGEQVHLINFQGSKYGHNFTVNLGFHYCFIPPQFHARSLPLTRFHLLDCVINERIGWFLPNHQDVWFDYGQNREVLISNLLLCATTCLAVFDRCLKRWLDPSVFLSDFAGDRKSEWNSHPDGLAMACAALRIGRFEEARRRLAHWEDGRYKKPPAIHKWLSNILIEQRQQGKNGELVPLPDWIAQP